MDKQQVTLDAVEVKAGRLISDLQGIIALLADHLRAMDKAREEAAAAAKAEPKP
jgi:hypothetical protein